MQDESEYEEARRLLTPLSGEPTGPSTIDIQRAIADGRRRIRMRRVAGIGAAAVVGGLVVAGVPVALDATRDPDRPPPVAAPASPTVSPSPAPTASPVPDPPTRCELDLLPEPEGAYQSIVTAADPTGRFIGGRTYTSGGPDDLHIQVVIWADGELTPVDVPGLDPSLTDLTSGGVGVGVTYSGTEAELESGWVYQDEEVFALAGGGISGLDRLTINEQGAIAGARPVPGGGLAPVVWRSPTAEPEQLSVPGPEWDVVARAVDADGTVVGTGYDRNQNPDSAGRTFVWSPDGTRQELPTPVIDGEPAHRFRAELIDGGVVTGLASRLVDGPEDVLHIVRFDLATGEATVVAEYPSIRPDVWNRHGWAAGAGPDGLVLWSPTGGTVPLADLDLPEADTLGFNLVATLSDDGRVAAGQVDDGQGNAHAARWRCD